MTIRSAEPAILFEPGSRHDHADDDRRPVGWYRDPTDSRHHRYWTGELWVDEPSLVVPPEPRNPAA